jgi:PPOX class probable F420-dependent enzyme
MPWLGVAMLTAPTPTPPVDRRPSVRARAAYHPRMTDEGTTGALATSILLPRVREFLAATRFVTIATVDPDGGPRQAVVWYRLDGDAIVLNSATGRRWPANLLRDQRISLTVIDAEDGYRWIGLSGSVTAVRDHTVTQADIAEMARRYHADEPDEAERLIRDRFERQERISFRVAISAVHDHLDD